MSEQSRAASFFVDFELEKTHVGEPTIQHRPSGIYLHSRQDPWHEAAGITRDWMKDCDILLWGLGLGYVAQSLLQELHKGSRLWIIETHPELQALAKDAHPTWELWRDNCVTIAATQSARKLASFLAEVPNTAEVRVHAPTQALLRWEGGQLAEVLESVTILWKSSRVQAEILQAQAEANAPYLARCRDASELFHRWEDKAVLVMGAGPSLTRVLDEFGNLAQRPRMIASNGALPVLAARSITPDIAICIEARASAKKDIEKSGFAGPLVIFPTVNHELLATYRGTLYLAFPDEPNNTSKCILNAGVGTVMAPALTLAVKMGGNPILLAGLDLSWEEDLYAAGVMRRCMMPQASVRATDVANRTLWTSPAFAAFATGIARIIENLKTENPHLRIYDLKSSGMRISETIPCPPEKLYELISIRETHPVLS